MSSIDISSARVIIANVISFIGSIFNIASLFVDRKKMLKFQLIDSATNTIANFVLCSYSAVATKVVTIARNIVAYKGKTLKKVQIAFVILAIILGVTANNRGIIGLIPVACTAMYTAIVTGTDKIYLIKFVIATNRVLLILYNLAIMNYVETVVSAILMVLALLNGIKQYKETSNNRNGKVSTR